MLITYSRSRRVPLRLSLECAASLCVYAGWCQERSRNSLDFKEYLLRTQYERHKNDEQWEETYIRNVPTPILEDPWVQSLPPADRDFVIYLVHTVDYKHRMAAKKAKQTNGATERDWMPLKSRYMLAINKNYNKLRDRIVADGYIECDYVFIQKTKCYSYRLGPACDVEAIRNPAYEKEFKEWTSRKSEFEYIHKAMNEKKKADVNKPCKALGNTKTDKRQSKKESVLQFTDPKPLEFVKVASNKDPYTAYQFTNKHVLRAIDEAKQNGCKLSEEHRWRKYMLNGSVEIDGVKHKAITVLPEMKDFVSRTYEKNSQKIENDRTAELKEHQEKTKKHIEAAELALSNAQGKLERLKRNLDQAIWEAVQEIDGQEWADDSREEPVSEGARAGAPPESKRPTAKKSYEHIDRLELGIKEAEEAVNKKAGRVVSICKKDGKKELAIRKKWSTRADALESWKRHAMWCYAELTSGKASYVICDMGRAHNAQASLPNECMKYVRMFGEPVGQVDYVNSQVSFMIHILKALANEQHPIPGQPANKAREWVEEALIRLTQVGKTRPIVYGEYQGRQKVHLLKKYATRGHLVANIRNEVGAWLPILKEAKEEIEAVAALSTEGKIYEEFARTLDEAEAKSKDKQWIRRRTSKRGHVFGSFSEMVRDKEQKGRSLFKQRFSFAMIFGHPSERSTPGKAIAERWPKLFEAWDHLKNNLDYGIIAKLAQLVESTEIFSLKIQGVNGCRHDSFIAPMSRIEPIEETMRMAFGGALKTQTTKPESLAKEESRRKSIKENTSSRNEGGKVEERPRSPEQSYEEVNNQPDTSKRHNRKAGITTTAQENQTLAPRHQQEELIEGASTSDTHPRQVLAGGSHICSQLKEAVIKCYQDSSNYYRKTLRFTSATATHGPARAAQKAASQRSLSQVLLSSRQSILVSTSHWLVSAHYWLRP